VTEKGTGLHQVKSKFNLSKLPPKGIRGDKNARREEGGGLFVEKWGENRVEGCKNAQVRVLHQGRRFKRKGKRESRGGKRLASLLRGHIFLHVSRRKKRNKKPEGNCLWEKYLEVG